jgi:hypothetical protein
MTVKHLPNFRRATPATCEYFYKYKLIIASASLDKKPRRPRRNQRLFWRREFDPFPGMPEPAHFRLPEFFQSFGPFGGLYSLTPNFHFCIFNPPQKRVRVNHPTRR